MLFRALKHLWHGSVLLLSLGFLILLAGCSQHTPPAAVPVPTVPAAVPVFTGRIFIYTVATPSQESQADPNDLVAVPITVDTKSNSPAKQAIQTLISYQNSPIPHGAKLLQITIDQASGLATLNFSNEFKDNFPGGDTREAQVLNSVLETMGQFPNVENVQFLVGGKKISSLGGTQDLTDPLPVIKATNEATAGN